MDKYKGEEAVGPHRYKLWRIWDITKLNLLFIMHNPSTANDKDNDKTVQRVIDYAKKWGYGGIYVGNLYAFRSTDPKEMRKSADPVGKDNIQNIKTLIPLCDKVIYAWGFDEKEPEWLRDIVETPYCIDVSKKGNPKHPGRLSKKLNMRQYERK